MAYPVLISKAPGHLGQRGVISPEGRFVPKEEVSPDHPCDIGFGLEIGASSVKELTPDQKRTALALLDQTVAKAREFLGEKPRTGFQPGMVVLIKFEEDHYLGILEELDKETVHVWTLLKNGERYLAHFPRSASFVREVPGHSGMEGLAHAAFFLNEIFDWKENHPRDLYSATTGTSLLAFVSDQKSLIAIARASSMFGHYKEVRHYAIRRVESFRAIIEMIERFFLYNAPYEHEDLILLSERVINFLKMASLEDVEFTIARFTDESSEYNRKLKSNRTVEYCVERARERLRVLQAGYFPGELG